MLATILDENDVRKIVNKILEEKRIASEQVSTSLDASYEPWCAEEDCNLRNEFNSILQMLASLHKRSTGAIRARLTKKELV